ncbi:MAG TPA: hypothetical protein VGW10_05705, partial [Solirubrobacteraceae bacterium]|nr:hypothetical protein [Solirubrobacteraceae bacterium]
GRRGPVLAFARRAPGPVQVDVFQQAIGRRPIRGRLVARFADAAGSVAWNGRANRPGRRVADGLYFVRFRMRHLDGATSYRRVALRRSRGRWSVRPSFYRHDSCGLVKSYKLTGPAFGGRQNRAIGISFRLNQAARVRVDVLRGSRVVRRFRAADRGADRIHRLRFGARGRPRGDYRFRLIAVRGSTTVRSILTSRRL